MPEQAKKRKPNPSFMKAVKPDAALAAIVGSEPQPRPQIVKRVWDYIKKNDLQDSKNKRTINADSKLQLVFDGKKQLTMFDMNKHIFQHIES